MTALHEQCCQLFSKESPDWQSQKSAEVAKKRHHLICIIHNMDLIPKDVVAEEKQRERDKKDFKIP